MRHTASEPRRTLVSYSEEYLARDQANAFAGYRLGRFNALIAQFCEDVLMYQRTLRKLVRPRS